MPVAVRPAGQVSDEDLMRFSARNKPYRVERNRDGEIKITTPVGGTGSGNEMDVAADLTIWARAGGTGRTFSSSAGFILPDGSCLSPDACYISYAKWNTLTPGQHAGFPPLCPDFLIEIRSQTDVRRNLENKMQLWIENGAQLAWLLDPTEASASIYRPGEPVQHLIAPRSIEGASPVAGFILNTGRLWPNL